MGGAGVGPPYLRRIVTKRPGFHPVEAAESFLKRATLTNLFGGERHARRVGFLRDLFAGKRDDPGQGLPTVPRGNAVVDHKRKSDRCRDRKFDLAFSAITPDEFVLCVVVFWRLGQRSLLRLSRMLVDV